MYKVTKIVGGGTSWYYLITPQNKFLMAAHEDKKDQLIYMRNVANLLTISFEN